MYKVDQQKWNASYKDAITNVQQTKNDYEYFRELQKLCSLLKDGHTKVYFPNDIQNRIMTTHFGAYRLFLANVHGKFFVYDTNKSKEKEIPVGSEILKVNGMSAQEYQIRYVNSYISTSTENDLNATAGYSLLAGVEGEQYDIEIKTPKGKIKKLHLIHSNTEETELSSKPLPQKGNFEFKWLKDDIAVIINISFCQYGFTFRGMDCNKFEKIFFVFPIRHLENRNYKIVY